MNAINEKSDVNNLKLLKNLYILIVEDDSALLEDMKSTIEIFCNNVYTATNGKEALEIIEKCSIDMILTDYVMPIMNGYELCQIVRETNKTIPIVIASNYSESDKLLKSIPLNLTEYLIKPINYTSLTIVLSKMVQKLKDSALVCEQISKSVKYNHITKALKSNDEIIPLTKNETLLLELFLKNKNSLVSNILIEYNINDSGLSNQAIKNLIHRLRLKIGKEYIVNIKEMGYKFIHNHE
jgi:DNA-binding response OmpR family regulator